MYKKVISFITALVLSVSCFVLPSNAASTTTIVQPISNSGYGVVPLYDNVMAVTSSISINSQNKAVCTGTYNMYYTKKSVISVSLMKSTDGVTNWTRVEGWSNTFRNSGSIDFSGTSTSALSSNYYYCTFVQVSIYNSRNEVIETVTCFSPAEHL